MQNPLPEFDRPPLDEVVMGVQFEPLEKFRAAHLGLYWSRIRPRYPSTQDQFPLAHIVEAPGLKPRQQAEVMNLEPKVIVPRCWFLDGSQNQLIQLQADRYLRNWRQLEGTEPYPRYPHLMQAFRQEWEEFLAFTKEENLGQPVVNQCELTYVNKLEQEAGWKDFSDLHKVFSSLRESGGKFLPPPELFTCDMRFKLPDGQGRLHVQVNPAFRGRDLQLILSMALTARGAPSGGSTDQIFAWFDLAHEWVVRAFDELTEPAMHEIWKKS